MSTPSALVQKLWNFCTILRDDGLSCGLAELAVVVSANRQRASYLRKSILQKAFTETLRANLDD